jgi:Mn2+/Fe2+ NRAMP family transporter
MMVVSFIWGQKHYRIPYAWKKLVAYMVIVVLLFFIHKTAVHFYNHLVFSLVFATVLLSIFMWFIFQVEKKEFKKLPVVGKFL